VLRIADRVAQHVLERQLTVVAQHRHPAAECARHHRRQQPRAGHDFEAESAHALDRHGRGRHALAAKHTHAVFARAVEHDRQFAAGTVQMRLDDLQDEAGGRGRVEGVAAFFEHRHGGRAGQPVRGRHHPEGSDQFRTRCERHLPLLMQWLVVSCEPFIIGTTVYRFQLTKEDY
jgi:hypothetical protein